jgi:hypothetical protein
MSVTISAQKWCSVRLYLKLSVGTRTSYLRYLCLFVHSGVQHILYWYIKLAPTNFRWPKTYNFRPRWLAQLILRTSWNDQYLLSRYLVKLKLHLHDNVIILNDWLSLSAVFMAKTSLQASCLLTNVFIAKIERANGKRLTF